jgi:hypothetical protein
MTKRPHRNEKGMYVIGGKQYKELFGSRQQVMNGTAYKTAGELCKTDLMMNKWGRIVSKKKHATAKKEKRLLKHGYTAKKGKFGSVKINKKTRNGRKSRKLRGGDKYEEENKNENEKEENKNQGGDNNNEEENKNQGGDNNNEEENKNQGGYNNNEEENKNQGEKNDEEDNDK